MLEVPITLADARGHDALASAQLMGTSESNVGLRAMVSAVALANFWTLDFGGCAFLPFSLGPTGDLVFGGFAFPPVSLGPAGDCPCKD